MSLVNIQQTKDPFSEVYTALVDHITREPRFVELVKPKNIWRFDTTEDKLGPYNGSDADMPSVVFLPANMASSPTASSTSGSHVLTVQVEIATPLTDARLLFAVYWSIVEAIGRDDLAPPSDKIARMVVTTDMQAAVPGLENFEITDGKRSWSAFLPITVEFWIDRQLTSKGGY